MSFIPLTVSYPIISSSLISEDELLAQESLKPKAIKGGTVTISSVLITAFIFIIAVSWFETLRVTFDITFNDRDRDKIYLLGLSWGFSLFITALLLVAIIVIDMYSQNIRWK